MIDDRRLKPQHHLASAFAAGLVGPLPATLLLSGLTAAGGLIKEIGVAEALVLALLSRMAIVSVPSAMAAGPIARSEPVGEHVASSLVVTAIRAEASQTASRSARTRLRTLRPCSVKANT